MEIRVNIPDPKLPNIPDYSKELTALVKAIRDSRNELLTTEISSLKELVKDKKSTELSAIEKRMMALERILGQIPSIIKELSKEKDDGSDKELLSYLRSAQQTTNELIKSLNNKPDVSSINSKLSNLERKLETFSLPQPIVVSGGQRIVPYVD